MINFKNAFGFSLIELMVVVGIIGILATLALPKLNVFMAKAKQSEAKTNLNSIYTLQESYKAEKGVYGTSIGLIGFNQPDISIRKYNYATARAGAGFKGYANNFVDLCSGGGGTADTWEIDQNKNLRATATVTCN